MQTPPVQDVPTSVDNDLVRPKARSQANRAAAPSPSANTVETLDTTTPAERQQAADLPTESGAVSLGRTIASLGSPTEPGFWLKTPLVRTQTPGRVVYLANGKSVQVTLIPIDGPPTAGSRMSLPALRILGAPLTGLPEVSVFSDG
ncbi:MAG: hypothetical protein AB8B71_06635 [Paracoccaceae bacterium]